MKTVFRTAAARGYAMMEVLMYISVVMVVLGVGYAALYKCMRNSVDMRRASDDVAKALNVGERWRQDVRNSTVVRWLDAPEGQALSLEGPRGTNAYMLSETNLCRRTLPAPWVVLISNVKNSAMEPCRSAEAEGWQWNLELATRARHSRIRPVFTFTAAQRQDKPK